MKNNTIRVCVGMNERKKIRYYRDFEIVDVDEMKDLADDFNINEMPIDAEQGNDKIYDYKYYFYDYELDGEICTRYLALPMFDYEGLAYDFCEESATTYNYCYKFYLDDITNALYGRMHNGNYFNEKEWQDIVDSLSDEVLDNYYTDFGRNNKIYDRDRAIKELEKNLKEEAWGITETLEDQETEYYGFL